MFSRSLQTYSAILGISFDEEKERICMLKAFSHVRTYTQRLALSTCKERSECPKFGFLQLL